MSQPLRFVFGSRSVKADSMIEFASGFLEAFQKEQNLNDAEKGVARLELHHPSSGPGADDCDGVPGGGQVLESIPVDGNDDKGEGGSWTPRRETRRRKCQEKFSPPEEPTNRSVKKSRRSADTVTAPENSVGESWTNKSTPTAMAPAKEHEDTPRPKVPSKVQVARGVIPSMMPPPPIPRQLDDRRDDRKPGRKGKDRRTHKKG